MYDTMCAVEEVSISRWAQRVTLLPNDLPENISIIDHDVLRCLTWLTHDGVCPFGVVYGRPDELTLVTCMP
jgi:hypothetical protein